MPRHLTELEQARAFNAAIPILTSDFLQAAAVKTDNATFLKKKFVALHAALFHEEAKKLSAMDGLWESMARDFFEGDSFTFRKDYSLDSLAELLAKYYKELLSRTPFGYGNIETITIFLMKVADSLMRKKQVLDFNRLTEAEDKHLFTEENPDIQPLKKMFSAALNDNKERALSPSSAHTSNPWERKLPESYRFDKTDKNAPLYFVHEEKHGQKYVLMENGGLYDFNEAARYAAQHQGSLDGLEISRECLFYKDHISKETNHLDGVPLGETVKAFRLDMDYLTGLYAAELKTLKGIFETKIKPALKETRYLTDLYFQQEAISTLPLTKEERVLVGKAQERLQYTAPIVKNIVEHELAKATPVGEEERPIFFLTVGPTGAGKGKMVKKAQSQTNDNIVIASLDDARFFFKDHQRLTNYFGLGHADDYSPYLLEAASLVRTWLIDEALKEKKHLVRDCSGIPFKDREEVILKRAKEAGYDTHVLLITAKAETTLPRSIKRFDEIGRWVPRSVILSKNAQIPIEAEAYFEHPELINCFELYDNNGDAPNSPPKKMAEMIDLPKPEKQSDDLVSLKGSKVLEIYHMDSFLSFLKQSEINPDAPCPEMLTLPTHPHHVPFTQRIQDKALKKLAKSSEHIEQFPVLRVS